MKKVKVRKGESIEKTPVELEDFSLFEEKMTKIKYLKECKQNIDKSFIIAAIEELELKGKRISAKRVKKICKKTVMNMIEEVEK
jgi:ribosomal protein S21